MPNNTSKEVSTGLTNVVYISISGIAYNNSGIYFPFNNTRNVDGNINSCIGAHIEKNKVRIECGTDRSGYIGYAIIEYTKTTD